MIETGLEGKVAVVTGGNNPSGIGAAVAKSLAEQGAAVFIHYFRQGAPGRDKEEAKTVDHTTPGLDLFYAMQLKSAEDIVRAVRDAGGRAESWEANLQDPAVVPEIFDRAEKTLGPVSILVNNAAEYEADTFSPDMGLEDGERAIWEGGPTRSTITAESHNRHFNVNSRAAALMMAELAKRHVARKEHWGRIINISSDCSQGSPAEVSYRASKHALESFSRSAAAELGPLGITVNVICPGPVQTGYIPPEVEKELLHSIPLGRVGKPGDISAAVLFLASDQAGWITGQVITVHGGHRMAPGL
jgi:3-oxoacyl-[acyl-carrier protein] reductase